MLSGLLNFIPGVGPILAQWKLILVVGLAAVLGWFIWDWEHRGKLLAEQAVQIATLQSDVKAAETREQVAADATEAVTARLNSQHQDSIYEQTIIQQVKHAPDSDNAPLAPVLRGALRGVAGMRKLDNSGAGP